MGDAGGGIDRRLHRCEKSTCHSRLVPAQHHLYVNDIKRRLEPMTQSLVQLEHQVQHLLRHFIKDGQTFCSTDSLHNEAKNGGAIAVHHGELGDPLHEPVEDHNHIGETATTLEPSHFPVIDANPSSIEMVQQPNHTSAVVDDYSAPLNPGTPQELSHPRHAHYKEGFNQEGPPLESIKEFMEDHNHTWPHYKHIHKEHTEPMRDMISKLEGRVEILSRQMKSLIGIEDGPREEKRQQSWKENSVR